MVHTGSPHTFLYFCKVCSNSSSFLHVEATIHTHIHSAELDPFRSQLHVDNKTDLQTHHEIQIHPYTQHRQAIYNNKTRRFPHETDKTFQPTRTGWAADKSLFALDGKILGSHWTPSPSQIRIPQKRTDCYSPEGLYICLLPNLVPSGQ